MAQGGRRQYAQVCEHGCFGIKYKQNIPYGNPQSFQAQLLRSNEDYVIWLDDTGPKAVLKYTERWRNSTRTLLLPGELAIEPYQQPKRLPGQGEIISTVSIRPQKTAQMLLNLIRKVLPAWLRFTSGDPGLQALLFESGMSLKMEAEGVVISCGSEGLQGFVMINMNQGNIVMTMSDPLNGSKSMPVSSVEEAVAQLRKRGGAPPAVDQAARRLVKQLGGTGRELHGALQQIVDIRSDQFRESVLRAGALPLLVFSNTEYVSTPRGSTADVSRLSIDATLSLLSGADSRLAHYYCSLVRESIRRAWREHEPVNVTMLHTLRSAAKQGIQTVVEASHALGLPVMLLTSYADTTPSRASRRGLFGSADESKVLRSDVYGAQSLPDERMMDNVTAAPAASLSPPVTPSTAPASQARAPPSPARVVTHVPRLTIPGSTPVPSQLSPGLQQQHILPPRDLPELPLSPDTTSITAYINYKQHNELGIAPGVGGDIRKQKDKGKDSFPPALEYKVLLLQTTNALAPDARTAAQQRHLDGACRLYPANMLLSELVLPKSKLLQLLLPGHRDVASCEAGVRTLQQTAMQLLAAYPTLFGCAPSAQQENGDAPLFDGAVHQISSTILEYCKLQRLDDSMHSDVAEFLDTLHAYASFSEHKRMPDMMIATAGGALASVEAELRKFVVEYWTPPLQRVCTSLLRLYTVVMRACTAADSATSYLMGLLPRKEHLQMVTEFLILAYNTQIKYATSDVASAAIGVAGCSAALRYLAELVTFIDENATVTHTSGGLDAQQQLQPARGGRLVLDNEVHGGSGQLTPLSSRSGSDSGRRMPAVGEPGGTPVVPPAHQLLRGVSVSSMAASTSTLATSAISLSSSRSLKLNRGPLGVAEVLESLRPFLEPTPQNPRKPKNLVYQIVRGGFSPLQVDALALTQTVFAPLTPVLLSSSPAGLETMEHYVKHHYHELKAIFARLGSSGSGSWGGAAVASPRSAQVEMQLALCAGHVASLVSMYGHQYDAIRRRLQGMQAADFLLSQLRLENDIYHDQPLDSWRIYSTPGGGGGTPHSQTGGSGTPHTQAGSLTPHSAAGGGANTRRSVASGGGTARSGRALGRPPIPPLRSFGTPLKSQQPGIPERTVAGSTATAEARDPPSLWGSHDIGEALAAEAAGCRDEDSAAADAAVAAVTEGTAAYAVVGGESAAAAAARARNSAASLSRPITPLFASDAPEDDDGVASAAQRVCQRPVTPLFTGDMQEDAELMEEHERQLRRYNGEDTCSEVSYSQDGSDADCYSPSWDGTRGSMAPAAGAPPPKICIPLLAKVGHLPMIHADVFANYRPNGENSPLFGSPMTMTSAFAQHSPPTAVGAASARVSASPHTAPATAVVVSRPVTPVFTGDMQEDVELLERYERQLRRHNGEATDGSGSDDEYDAEGSYTESDSYAGGSACTSPAAAVAAAAVAAPPKIFIPPLAKVGHLPMTNADVFAGYRPNSSNTPLFGSPSSGAGGAFTAPLSPVPMRPLSMAESPQRASAVAPVPGSCSIQAHQLADVDVWASPRPEEAPPSSSTSDRRSSHSAAQALPATVSPFALPSPPRHSSRHAPGATVVHSASRLGPSTAASARCEPPAPQEQLDLRDAAEAGDEDQYGGGSDGSECSDDQSYADVDGDYSDASGDYETEEAHPPEPRAAPPAPLSNAPRVPPLRLSNCADKLTLAQDVPCSQLTVAELPSYASRDQGGVRPVSAAADAVATGHPKGGLLDSGRCSSHGKLALRLTLQQSYRSRRGVSPLYLDESLHQGVLELMLSMLLSSEGRLHPELLPRQPTDSRLQNTAVMLLHHLSHPDNGPVVRGLYARCEHRRQQLQAAAQRAVGSVADSLTHAAAQQAAILRLLKLLSAPLLDPTRYQGTERMCKGAFAEIYTARMALLSGSTAAEAAPAETRGSGAARVTSDLVELTAPEIQPWPLMQLEQQQLSPGDRACEGPQGSSEPEAVAVVIKACDVNQTLDNCFNFMKVFSEVSILEGLKGQPGVVELLDYGLHDKKFHMVLQRYRCSLRQWRFKQPEEEFAPHKLKLYLTVFSDIVQHVQLLASRHVVHFDLKCDNILLQPLPGVSDAQFYAVDAATSTAGGMLQLPFRSVLADFGEAVQYGSAAEAFTHRPRGTECFQAPEVVLMSFGKYNPANDKFDRRKHKGAGVAADVWSLGCLLYELLTGSLLFARNQQLPGGDAAVVFRIAFGDKPGDNRTLDDEYRAALHHNSTVIQLLEHILQRDPMRRPSVCDVAAKVKAIIAGL